MRINMLTLTFNDNYGGLLQAYALQTKLEELGHNVIVFDSRKVFKIKKWKIPLAYLKRILKRMLGLDTEIFFEKRLNQEYDIVSQHSNRFLKDYIHRYEILSFKQLKENDYEAFVVGSDQIWRPRYRWFGKIEHSYLDFASSWNVKRISYAASFGVDEWEYTSEETANCSKLISKFDAVSVREASGIDLCREHLGRNDAVHVLDPTMLLEPADYQKIWKAYGADQSPGNLMYYILDEDSEKMKLVDLVENETGLKKFRTGFKADNRREPIEKRIHPPVEEWLRGFYDAEFVVTDSFHGCVFSIIFRKPFIVYGNENRGMARFSSLLSMFGLEDRMVTGSVDTYYIKKLVEQKIDYDRVYEILNKKRTESMDFLKKALA